MRIIALALLALLAASPAYAINEFQWRSIEDVSEQGKSHGMVVEKLSDADAAKVDAAAGPRPVQESSIYLLTLDQQVVIALVVDGTIVFSTQIFKLETINKILQRNEAEELHAPIATPAAHVVVNCGHVLSLLNWFHGDVAQAIRWARQQGYSPAAIEAAKRCLR